MGVSSFFVVEYAGDALFVVSVLSVSEGERAVESFVFCFFQQDIDNTSGGAGFVFSGGVGDDFDADDIVGRHAFKVGEEIVSGEEGFPVVDIDGGASGKAGDVKIAVGALDEERGVGEYVEGGTTGGEGGVGDVEDEFVGELLKGWFLAFYDDFVELGGGVGQDDVEFSRDSDFIGIGF